jgi:type II secretory pathway pseudopilin PulG
MRLTNAEHRSRASFRQGSDAGFSLVETVIATAILLVVLVGLMSAMAMAAALTENEGHLSARAAEYAQDKMEQLLALAYSDATSDTTQIPTSATNGAGLALGGSQDPAAPAAKYVDYLDSDGKPLCPCSGTAVPDKWFYKRVWQVSTPAGTTDLKQITVTAIVARSVANKVIPRATVTALRSKIGNE